MEINFGCPEGESFARTGILSWGSSFLNGYFKRFIIIVNNDVVLIWALACIKNILWSCNLLKPTLCWWNMSYLSSLHVVKYISWRERPGTNKSPLHYLLISRNLSLIFILWALSTRQWIKHFNINSTKAVSQTNRDDS